MKRKTIFIIFLLLVSFLLPIKTEAKTLRDLKNELAALKKKKSDTGNYLKKINEYISIIKENKHYVIEPFSKWEDYNPEKDPIKDQWYFLTRDKYKDLINDFEKLRKNLLANKTFDGKKKLSNDSTINRDEINNTVVYHINDFISLIKQMLKIDPYE